MDQCQPFERFFGRSNVDGLSVIFFVLIENHSNAIRKQTFVGQDIFDDMHNDLTQLNNYLQCTESQ